MGFVSPRLSICPLDEPAAGLITLAWWCPVQATQETTGPGQPHCLLHLTGCGLVVGLLCTKQHSHITHLSTHAITY